MVNIDVNFSIPALEFFENWDLGDEICYSIYSMADDNEFGDELSEAILDICGNDYNHASWIFSYITYKSSDLKAIEARRWRDNDFDIVYTIPVAIDI